MKIALVGAHGVGKTTLAMKLAEHLNIPFIPEYAREVLKRIGKNWRYLKDQEWIEFQMLLMAERIKTMHEAPEHYVMDRTVIDVAAYTIMGLIHRDEMFQNRYAGMIADMCLFNATIPKFKPDFCLFLRWPGWNSPIDGKEIDERIYGLLLRCDWPYESVSPKRTSIKEILAKLKLWLDLTNKT